MRLQFILFGLLILSSSAALGAPSALKIATEGQFPPFNFYEKNELRGFEVDIANAIAEDLKIQTTWKTYPFDSLLIGLNEHKYDLVIASHGITPERAKAVDFSEPHYCGGGLIVSRPGGPKTVAELKGKKIAVQVGTTWFEKLREIPGVAAVKTYPKDTDALQNLLGGRADAWVTDRFAAVEMLKKQAGKLQTGDLLFNERIAMAVAKGNAELLKSVNASLARIMANGTYSKLSMKYFGEDIRCK
jgi:polar amino acid transport system substrate-binding protein